MMDHIVMQLPTGTLKCLGSDIAAAMVRARSVLEVTGTVTLDVHRVEPAEWNDGRISQHWCPDRTCSSNNPEPVGIPNILLEPEPEEILLHSAMCLDMACSGCINAPQVVAMSTFPEAVVA